MWQRLTEKARRTMWQRLTEKARRAVIYADEEADLVRSTIVGTEHLLLGLLHMPDSVAWRILEQNEVDPGDLRDEMWRRLRLGDGKERQERMLSRRGKQVIDMAYDEARRLSCDCIGTEHLLLGLLRVGRGEAGKALVEAGIDLGTARKAVGEGEYTMETKHADVTTVATDALRGRDLLSIRDLTRDEVYAIFQVAGLLKGRTLQYQVDHPILPGKTLAMIFEKPSLRTRVTFETGMTQLGGHAIYIQPSDIALGTRESVPDAARNFERMVQGIMARVFSHQTVVDLAKYANIPVINGLSDLEHPCQALADFLTIYEKKGDPKGLKVAYIGDGSSNTCHSLMLLAAKLGANFAVGCPEGYEPDTVIHTAAKREADENGATITITTDPMEAARDADAIYTDVWTSMGQEAESEVRLPIFRPYQVNQALVDVSKADSIVLHCLPAHRGEEITDEVIDGPQSVVFDEAENRLHAQKAVMALVM